MPTLRLEADGKLLANGPTPSPMGQLKAVRVSGYECAGRWTIWTIRNGAWEIVFRETFDNAVAGYGGFRDDFARGREAAVGLVVFQRRHPGLHHLGMGAGDEHGVEGGRLFDWWEVDAYLRKIAALDPNGRLHMRFHFGVPPDWWAAKHPDELGADTHV